MEPDAQSKRSSLDELLLLKLFKELADITLAALDCMSFGYDASSDNHGNIGDWHFSQTIDIATTNKHVLSHELGELAAIAHYLELDSSQAFKSGFMQKCVELRADRVRAAEAKDKSP